MPHRAVDQVNLSGSPGPQPTQPPDGTLALFRRVEYLLVAVALVGVLDTLRFAVYYIPFRFDLNFEEGNQLLAALRIAHGQSPYPPVGGLPYIVNPYGPVFYYADSVLAKWFGASLVAPRLLVLASTFAVALFIVLLLKRWTRSWTIALGFGLSFPAVSLVRDWSHVVRVDIFGLALAMAGLYIFARGRSLMWPALLFLLALNTKITLLAAPVACFLYLVLDRQRRRAWRFAAWLILFGVAGLVAVGATTGGWGLFQMLHSHPDQYRISWYLSRLRPFLLLNVALLAGLVALGVHDFRRRSFSLPFIYGVLATCMTFTIGQWANDANHLLEWQAALCLAAACGYHELRNRPKADVAAALIPLGLIVLVALGLPESRRLSPELAGCPAAYQFAQKQPGQLLTENSGILALAGKPVWLNNSFEYAILGKTGRLDQQPLIRMVHRKLFGLILLGAPPAALESGAAHYGLPTSIWPEGFVSALLGNNHPVARFACADAAVAYEPNPPPPAKVASAH